MLRGLCCALLLLATPALAADPCDPGGHGTPCEVSSGHYRIRLPEGAGPHPAVLYLYGSGGRSGRLTGSEGFVNAFTDRGYAVIVPAALTVRYRDGSHDSGWSLRNTGTRKRDELAFLTDVLNDAVARFRVDRSRILMAGMSNGGFLTWEIACRAPGFAAAYAPVAASRMGDVPRCAAPVRLLHTHGRSDEVVRIDGELWRTGGRTMYPPLTDLLDAFAGNSGCLRSETSRDGGFERTNWSDCAPGGSLSLLMHEGGHTIPFAWYSAVIDWFEGRRPAAAPSPRSPGPTFRSVGERSGRFKRATP